MTGQARGTTPDSLIKILDAENAEVASKLAKAYSDKNDKNSVAQIAMMFRTVMERVTSKLTDLTKENISLKAEKSTLEEKTKSLESKCEDLEDRLIRSEAYAGRATSIFTGIVEKPGENITQVVADEVKRVIPGFSTSDISIAHRNRSAPTSNNDKKKPRTVTVVFKSVSHKDTVSDFSKMKPLRDRKLGVFHYAPASVRERKKELEERTDVERVYYDGPNKLFSVKLKTGDFVRRVLTAEQIDNHKQTVNTDS